MAIYAHKPILTLSQLQLTVAWSPLQPAAREDAKRSCRPNVEAVRGRGSLMPCGQGPWPWLPPRPQPPTDLLRKG